MSSAWTLSSSIHLYSPWPESMFQSDCSLCRRGGYVAKLRTRTSGSPLSAVRSTNPSQETTPDSVLPSHPFLAPCLSDKAATDGVHLAWSLTIMRCSSLSCLKNLLEESPGVNEICMLWLIRVTGLGLGIKLESFH